VEVAPGIHRIESDLGSRLMCQYLLVGEERTLLVDTGLRDTPAQAIEPYAAGLGLDLADLDYVLISHADVDHCGGDRALRERAPGAFFLSHELDRRWIESNRAMLAENYLWYEAYGFGPDEEARRWILQQLGGDCPVDLGLRGGETIRLGSDWRIEILHMPGHTPGHLALWDSRSGALLAIDAVLERGVYDRAGNRLIPPRYYDAGAYETTIRRAAALRPDVLLTAHYPVMSREEAAAFLEESLDFTHDLRAAVEEGVRAGTTDLWQLTRAADRRLGPYPEFVVELGASVRAHMAVPGAPAAASSGVPAVG
jgi:glyoxylase-like metal-dependent hydrolase (beta-lactamase superfamily II)